MKRYLTGLDWSGDPGDPSRSQRSNQVLVVAACTIDLFQHKMLDECLALLRARMRVADTHVFRYANSSDSMRSAFFDAVAQTPISIRSTAVDKRRWSRSYIEMTLGPERIRDEIVRAIHALDDEWVDGQKLLVDMQRGEKGFIESVRREVRSSLTDVGRASFGKVVARPDHRADAAVIQVADMFAGHIRAATGRVMWGKSGQLKILQNE